MNRNRRIRNLLYLVMSGCFLSSSLTLANEPLPEADLKLHVEIKSNKLAEVVIENNENDHAEVKLSRIHHLPIGNIGGFAFHPPINIGIPSHKIGREKFEIEPANNGIVVVHFQSQVTLRNRQVKNGPTLYQIFKNTPNGLKEVSFDDAFLKKRIEILKPGEKSREAELNLGAGFVAKLPLAALSFKAHVLDPAQARLIQPVKLASPLEMANKLQLRQIPAISKRAQSGRPGAGLSPFENLLPEDSDLESPNDSNLNNYDIQPMEGFALERSEDVDRNLNLMSNLSIKGHMSTKYADGSFHAAWGWVVTAWQNQKIAGINIYMPLGWTYVNGDGSWSIPLASFASASSPVFIQYQTANRFVRLQDPSGHIYTWGDWWNLSGNSTDIGYRFADLSANGDLPGIDKLYEGATEEWSKLYYNGLNPLRNEPIEVTYPNSLSSGHCIMNKDSSGKSVPAYAWSCSEWSNGKIWIIPAHGDKSVVQHEVAHSINSFFWNGNLSSGAGGAHSLDGCYNGGLALTEGFANFMTYWVQFDRVSSNPIASYFNANLDSYNGDNSCSSGEVNEMRVAATFWDMYDTRNDGPDSNRFDGWHYIDQISPVALYLKNGTHQKMSEYLSIVDAGDPNWFAADRALFRLNRIIP